LASICLGAVKSLICLYYLCFHQTVTCRNDALTCLACIYAAATRQPSATAAAAAPLLSRPLPLHLPAALSSLSLLHRTDRYDFSYCWRSPGVGLVPASQCQIWASSQEEQSRTHTHCH